MTLLTRGRHVLRRPLLLWLLVIAAASGIVLLAAPADLTTR